MADEPKDATLRILRDMRKRLDKLDTIEDTVKRTESRLNELFDLATYALGLASSNHIRADKAEAQLNALRARVDALEGVK